jgi:hypothetical protein
MMLVEAPEESKPCQEKCPCGATCERIDAHTEHECQKCCLNKLSDI